MQNKLISDLEIILLVFCSESWEIDFQVNSDEGVGLDIIEAFAAVDTFVVRYPNLVCSIFARNFDRKIVGRSLKFGPNSYDKSFLQIFFIYIN